MTLNAQMILVCEANIKQNCSNLSIQSCRSNIYFLLRQNLKGSIVSYQANLNSLEDLHFLHSQFTTVFCFVKQIKPATAHCLIRLLPCHVSLPLSHATTHAHQCSWSFTYGFTMKGSLVISTKQHLGSTHSFLKKYHLLGQLLHSGVGRRGREKTP